LTALSSQEYHSASSIVTIVSDCSFVIMFVRRAFRNPNAYSCVQNLLIPAGNSIGWRATAKPAKEATTTLASKH
jgi:hypothetical protein